MRVLRAVLAGVLLGTGLGLVPVANLAVWAHRELLDTNRFAHVSAEVLRLPPVRDALARAVRDELVVADPRLAASGDRLFEVARSVIGSDAFTQTYESAVGGMLEQLRAGSRRLTLDLDPMLAPLRSALATSDPSAAALIPASGLGTVPVLSKRAAPLMWEVTRFVRNLWLVVVLGTAALLGAAVFVARRRGRVLVTIGVTVVVMAMVIVAALTVGHDLLVNAMNDDVSQSAFDSGWDRVTGSFVSQTVLLGGLGFVVGAVGVAVGAWGLLPTRSRPSRQASSRMTGQAAWRR